MCLVVKIEFEVCDRYHDEHTVQCDEYKTAKSVYACIN